MKPKKLKVGIVSISLAKGGAERSAAVLTHLLSDLGYDVCLILLTNQIDYDFKGELYNLGKEKEKANHPLARLVRFIKLKHFLKTTSFDVIIDHRPKNNYLRELFYSKFIYRGISKIYVIHSSKTSTNFPAPLSKMIQIYQSNFQNVGVSKFITENLLRKQGISNAVCIPNAFLNKWNSNSEQNNFPKQLKNISTYLLFYGRIDDQSKDIKFLIDSFTQSKLWEKGIYLVIMGEGPDKAVLSSYAQQQQSTEKILFLPFQSNPFSVVQKARAVTLTSQYEGFPMVIIETLALGTPVVSLDFVSGPAEVIQHKKNGLLIKNRSTSDFATALKRICLDNELHTYCCQNAQKSVVQFSERQIAQQWNLLLHKLLEKQEN